MQKSAEVMKQMNMLTHVNEVAQIMQGLSKEMMKAGLIDEMMDDAFTVDDDVEEEELDEEVSKVVAEVMHAKMEGARVGTKKLPEQVQQQEEVAEDEDDEEADKLMAQFQQLRGGVA